MRFLGLLHDGFGSITGWVVNVSLGHITGRVVAVSFGGDHDGILGGRSGFGNIARSVVNVSFGHISGGVVDVSRGGGNDFRGVDGDGVRGIVVSQGSVWENSGVSSVGAGVSSRVAAESVAGDVTGVAVAESGDDGCGGHGEEG